MAVKKPKLPGVWIHGASGRMGQLLQSNYTASRDHRLVGGSDLTFCGQIAENSKPVTLTTLAKVLVREKMDLIVDFSGPGGNKLLADALRKAGMKRCAVLIGTTGLTDKRLARWKQLAGDQQIRVLRAPNTSLGILLALKCATALAGICTGSNFDIEIVETHHRAKADSPSGTAGYIAESLKSGIKGLRPKVGRCGARQPGEIGMHAVRGGGVFGEHSVRFIGDNEEITISHRAFSRDLFAQGAMVLGRWLIKQPKGFYNLTDIQLEKLL